MKELIKHLVRENHDEIMRNTLFNCHAKGLHSIMFIDKPEQRIRAFIAENDHELWKNGKSYSYVEDMSVGFHSHHCNVTLAPIYGDIYNVSMKEVNPGSGVPMVMYKYHSKILAGEQRFTKLNELTVQFEDKSILDPRFLHADEYHSIYVPKGQRAAWFVFEGKKWADYQPICISNSKTLDTQPDDPAMYLKLTLTEFQSERLSSV